jgi:CBS domain-containing protein
MLPVVDNNDLVGIITDRYLKKASASDATNLDIHEIFYLIAKIKIKTKLVHMVDRQTGERDMLHIYRLLKSN